MILTPVYGNISVNIRQPRRETKLLKLSGGRLLIATRYGNCELHSAHPLYADMYECCLPVLRTFCLS